MKVFQSIIYFAPEKGDAVPEIIQDVTTHIVENQEQLQRKLIRQIPDKYEDNLDSVIIVIRPF